MQSKKTVLVILHFITQPKQWIWSLFLLSLTISSCGYLNLDILSKGGPSSAHSGSHQNSEDPMLAPLKLSLTSSVESSNEGSNIVFTVSLNHPSANDITFTFSTQSMAAVANVDFLPLQGTITIPAGQTQAIINIPTLSRTGFQGDRNFQLNISNVVGAPVETPQITETAVIKEVQIKPGMTFDLNRTPDQIPVTSFNGNIYFVNFDETSGYELWKTNGTVTTSIKDINPGPESAFSISANGSDLFVEMIGYLYFGASQKDFGFELWRTDGTEGGTTLVIDLYEGIFSGLTTNRLMTVFKTDSISRDRRVLFIINFIPQMAPPLALHCSNHPLDRIPPTPHFGEGLRRN
jgi:ELWxxDGT repeat protein